MKKRTLAWWDSNNFGDALNPYIFWAFGIRVSYEQANKSDALALGSLLERIFEGAHTKNETYFSEQPIDVWGSGVHFESGQHTEQPNIVLPERFIRKPNFHAVRGKITKNRVELMLGEPLAENIALGDPGILMNRIIKGSKEKVYDLGIVAHFLDVESEHIKKINKLFPNSIVIDVRSDPKYFIKKMTQCKAIISTAMHPIIVADSYGIPNLWICTGNEKISTYKWDDYYSVYGFDKAPVHNLSEKEFDENSLKELHTKYSIQRDSVKKIQESLIRAFPFQTSKGLGFLSFIDIARLRWREVNSIYSKTKRLSKMKIFAKKYLTF